MELITNSKNVKTISQLLEELYPSTPPEVAVEEFQKLMSKKTPLQRAYENVVCETYGIGKPKPISHTANKKRKSKRRNQSRSRKHS